MEDLESWGVKIGGVIPQIVVDAPRPLKQLDTETTNVEADTRLAATEASDDAGTASDMSFSFDTGCIETDALIAMLDDVAKGCPGGSQRKAAKDPSTALAIAFDDAADEAVEPGACDESAMLQPPNSLSEVAVTRTDDPPEPPSPTSGTESLWSAVPRAWLGRSPADAAGDVSSMTRTPSSWAAANSPWENTEDASEGPWDELLREGVPCAWLSASVSSQAAATSPQEVVVSLGGDALKSEDEPDDPMLCEAMVTACNLMRDTIREDTKRFTEASERLQLELCQIQTWTDRELDKQDLVRSRIASAQAALAERMAATKAQEKALRCRIEAGRRKNEAYSDALLKKPWNVIFMRIEQQLAGIGQSEVALTDALEASVDTRAQLQASLGAERAETWRYSAEVKQNVIGQLQAVSPSRRCGMNAHEAENSSWIVRASEEERQLEKQCRHLADKIVKLTNEVKLQRLARNQLEMALEEASCKLAASEIQLPLVSGEESLAETASWDVSVEVEAVLSSVSEAEELLARERQWNAELGQGIDRLTHQMELLESEQAMNDELQERISKDRAIASKQEESWARANAFMNARRSEVHGVQVDLERHTSHSLNLQTQIQLDCAEVEELHASLQRQRQENSCVQKRLQETLRPSPWRRLCCATRRSRTPASHDVYETDRCVHGSADSTGTTASPCSASSWQQNDLHDIHVEIDEACSSEGDTDQQSAQSHDVSFRCDEDLGRYSATRETNVDRGAGVWPSFAIARRAPPPPPPAPPMLQYDSL
jgi:hypothetical protein